MQDHTHRLRETQGRTHCLREIQEHNVPSPRSHNHDESAGAGTHILGLSKAFGLGFEASYIEVKARSRILAGMYHPDTQKSEMKGLTLETQYGTHDQLCL